MNNILEIIYQNEYLVAINKPNGLAVHRSKLVGNAEVFALQLLRDQLQQKVHTIHRLDRKTSGVLLFGLSNEVSGRVQKQFEERTVSKKYYAIVRGYTKDEETIDYDLVNDNGKYQEAITTYRTLSRCELPIAFGKHSTSRYSLIQITPLTGRTHQIRRHLNHLRHPIIGDRPHGCNKQNKLFKEKWGLTNMMLHAENLRIKHPISNKEIEITARFPTEFSRMISTLGLSLQLP